MRTRFVLSAPLVLLLLESCAGTPPPEQPGASESAPTLRLARAARAAGDYASAINLYRSVLAGKTDPLLAVELGNTMLDAGSIDDAMTTYAAVPAGSPGGAGAALGMERAWLELGDTGRALEAAEKAHALAPGDLRVLIDRGIALDLAGQHGAAQESYRAALAKSPNNRAARVDLALSLAFTKSYREAAAIVTPIAGSSNATARERQDLALIYGLEGDDPEARRWSLMDLDPAAAADNLKFFSLIRDGH